MALFQTQKFIEAQRAKGISDKIISDFLRKKGISADTPTEEIARKGERNFLERLRLSFGDPEARAQIEKIERQQGTRGKFDIGDIADVAGEIPALFGFLGGAALGSAAGPGGTIAGGAAGAAAGETVRQAIGKKLGTREKFSAKEIAIEGATGLAAGGLGKLFKFARPALTKTKQVAGKVSGATGRTVGRVAIGPTGSRGLVQRFQRPKEVAGLLKTLRGVEGGTPIESIGTQIKAGQELIKKRAGKAFEVAEGKIAPNKVLKSRVKDEPREIIKEFLKIDGKLTVASIRGSGQDDANVRLIVKVLQKITQHNVFTTRGVLALKRQIAGLPRKRGTPADALINKLTGKTGHFNQIISEVDKPFRAALTKFSETKTFTTKLDDVIIASRSKDPDAITNRVVALAKSLDDPTRKEAAEKLVLELERRLGPKGPKLIQQLRDLATVIDLEPPGSKGFRAGIIREVVRIAQGIVSAGVGLAGRGAQVVGKAKAAIPKQKVPQQIKSLTGRGALFEGLKSKQ